MRLTGDRTSFIVEQLLDHAHRAQRAVLAACAAISSCFRLSISSGSRSAGDMRVFYASAHDRDARTKCCKHSMARCYTATCGSCSALRRAASRSLRAASRAAHRSSARVPCVACGHTNRPRSRRLANRHMPIAAPPQDLHPIPGAGRGTRTAGPRTDPRRAASAPAQPGRRSPCACRSRRSSATSARHTAARSSPAADEHSLEHLALDRPHAADPRAIG